MVFTILASAASFVAGAVFSFLFFRKNPKLAAQANTVVSQASGFVSNVEKKL